MGKARFYCHGLPGSALEAARLGSDITTIAPMDLQAFEAAHSGKPASVIAFSLGAMTALHLAAEYPDRVSNLRLIAPAAPLALGDFLPDMAGAPVFRLALRGKARFTAFTDSPASDQILLEQPAFRQQILHSLRETLIRDRARYIESVMHYVGDWADVLPRVSCPVHIYRSRADNWVPVAMTDALVAALPGDTSLSTYEALGHYGTLSRALSDIGTAFAQGSESP
jgi:pimeloyl-ACP methyl ester carboxylesterase